MVKHWREQRGQAILEWAFVMPLLAFMVLGVVVVATLVNTKLATSGAAREAARNYAIYKDSARAACMASGYLYGSLLAGSVADCRTDASGVQRWGEGTRCSVSMAPDGFSASPPAQPCAVEVYVPSGGDTVEVRVTYWQNVFVPGLYRLVGGTERLGSGVAGLEDRMPISASVVFRLEE